jgi:hypothetical protein
MVVDARAHCFEMSAAEVIQLTSNLTCTIKAVGGASHGWAGYKSAIISYLSDTRPPLVMFSEVFANAGERDLGGLGTPIVYQFFQDSYAGDNSGGFDIEVRLDDFVLVEQTTWGRVKDGARK